MRKIHLHAPVTSKTPDQGETHIPLIVLIDDSQTVRKIVETCLNREGVEVKSFSDGIEALQWFLPADARIPEVVLLDIGLPRIDGYEVARRLRSKPQFNTTVIIMLSRRDRVLDRLKGRLAGARDYLTKPFRTQDLVAVVKMHLHQPIQ